MAHAWKDIKRMLRDKKALMITVLMPTILTVILGLSIGNMMNGERELDTIPIAVVDQSQSASFRFNQPDQEETINFATIFTDDVLGSEGLEDLFDYEELSEEVALNRLDQGKLSTVILFPPSFNQEVVEVMSQPSSKEVEVVLYQNPDESLHNEMVKGVVESFTNQLSKSVIANDTMMTLMVKQPDLQQEISSSIGDVLENINRSNQPTISITRQSFGEIESLTGMQYFTAGMAVMFMLYVGGYSAIYVRDEIRNQTYNRLRATGMTYWHVAGGKFISTTLLVFIQMLFLFSFEHFVFGMDFMNVWLLLFVMLITSFSVACLSILLTTITILNQETRLNELFQSVIIPFMAMLGGSFISISLMPEPIQFIGNHLLNGAALQGFSFVMQGYSFSELGEPVMALILNGILFLLITGLLVLNKKEVFR